MVPESHGKRRHRCKLFCSSHSFTSASTSEAKVKYLSLKISVKQRKLIFGEFHNKPVHKKFGSLIVDFNK